MKSIICLTYKYSIVYFTPYKPITVYIGRRMKVEQEVNKFWTICEEAGVNPLIILRGSLLSADEVVKTVNEEIGNGNHN